MEQNKKNPKNIYIMYFPDPLLKKYEGCISIKIGCSNRNDRINILQPGYIYKISIFRNYTNINYIKDKLFKNLLSLYHYTLCGGTELYKIPISEYKLLLKTMDLIFQKYDNYRIKHIENNLTIEKIYNIVS